MTETKRQETIRRMELLDVCIQGDAGIELEFTSGDRLTLPASAIETAGFKLGDTIVVSCWKVDK